MSHESNTEIPKVSRKWSDEAVRGSVESSFYKSSSGSPAQEEEPQPEGNTNLDLITEWLGHQGTEDPSTILDAVSDLVTPISSPNTSVDSPTFTTQPGLSRPTVEPLMPPPSSSRPQRRSPEARIPPREPTPQSTEHDLLGVGAFAEPHRPR
ncbi:Fc.00g066350.m01.CDS01 [Cosmosporella sp. VM-42]